MLQTEVEWWRWPLQWEDQKTWRPRYLTIIGLMSPRVVAGLGVQRETEPGAKPSVTEEGLGAPCLTTSRSGRGLWPSGVGLCRQGLLISQRVMAWRRLWRARRTQALPPKPQRGEIRKNTRLNGGLLETWFSESLDSPQWEFVMSDSSLHKCHR